MSHQHLARVLDTLGPADADLLARFARDRDEAAFAVLVGRHARMVLRVCRGVLHDHHAAEDAAQATFLALARQAGTIRQGTVPGWLFRVARRTATRARAGRREHVRLDPEAHPLPTADTPRLTAEDEQTLHEELARLPERYRTPVLLCFFGGMSHAAAARYLGCPVGTVNTRIARAKGLLACRLGARGVTPAVLGGLVAVPPAFAGATAAVAVSLTGGIATDVPVRVVGLVNTGGRTMISGGSSGPSGCCSRAAVSRSGPYGGRPRRPGLIGGRPRPNRPGTLHPARRRPNSETRR
ncbi:MAG TPA: RNA polymerase sigma factor [Urbifossiella sp.]|jgi:RNA polymerase sigma factor (sigma-70 family)|nr:RNA polymerase sigma factor [Urbifossiella sp.]